MVRFVSSFVALAFAAAPAFAAEPPATNANKETTAKPSKGTKKGGKHHGRRGHKGGKKGKKSSGGTTTPAPK